MRGLTKEDARLKIFLCRWCILLQIAFVVIEGAAFSKARKVHRVFQHFRVQLVEMVMGNGILDHNETILDNRTYSLL